MAYIVGMRTAAEDREISRRASERYFMQQEMAARKAEGRYRDKDSLPASPWESAWQRLVRMLQLAPSRVGRQS